MRAAIFVLQPDDEVLAVVHAENATNWPVCSANPIIEAFIRCRSLSRYACVQPDDSRRSLLGCSGDVGRTCHSK